MTKIHPNFTTQIHDYLLSINSCFTSEVITSVEILADKLYNAWICGNQVFICGNGGSGANALHMSNDFHYGIGACSDGKTMTGLKVEALSANTAILTCLANDTGYSNIYAHQLQVKGNPDDLLIVLSGSGNSPNVVNALLTAKAIGMNSHAIVAFNGGQCKKLADSATHCVTNDMQIAEDTQLVIGHICMQWLNANKPLKLKSIKNA